MTRHGSRIAWMAALLALSLSRALPAAAVDRDWSAYPAIVVMRTNADVYAMGDVHGDRDTMVHLLTAAKLARADGDTIRWTGGNSVLVCTGDLIDKFNHSMDVIATLRDLQKQAERAGGRVIVTMGNHEAEFLAGKTSEKEGPHLTDELRKAGIERSDVLAGRDRAGIGRFLIDLPIAARVNDFFFCHAGDTHGMTFEQLDSELTKQITAEGFGARILSDPDSMLEARMHPAPWWERDAHNGSGEQLLRSDITALGAKHLVFGHQPGKVRFADGTKRKRDQLVQEFNGLVFLIDVGMSRGVDAAPAAMLRIHENDASRASVAVIHAGGASSPFWSASR